jgi:hypothetical protein
MNVQFRWLLGTMVAVGALVVGHPGALALRRTRSLRRSSGYIGRFKRLHALCYFMTRGR